LIMASLLDSAVCRAEEEEKPAQGDRDQPSMQAPSMEAMSAEFMKKVMETSARIEAMKKEIADREQFLYENHPELKAVRSQMIEIQKTINRILDEDEELARMKMDRDILWSIMPTLPSPPSPGRPLPPGAMPGR
jgi:hypothetical protein